LRGGGEASTLFQEGKRRRMHAEIIGIDPYPVRLQKPFWG